MAEKNETLTISKQKTADSQKQNALSNLLSDIDTVLAISVLKIFSSEDNPMPLSKIGKTVSDFRYPADDDETSNEQDKRAAAMSKKISRKLDDYMSIMRLREESAATYEWDKLPNYDDLPETDVFYCALADLLCLVFGGVVRCTQKGVKKYYFLPLVRPAHIDMIKSCLIANQYFSERETTYLIHAVESLGAAETVAKPISGNRSGRLPVHTDEELSDMLYSYLQAHSVFLSSAGSDKKDKPERTHPLLHIISQLHTAIAQGRQIELVKGSYRKNDNDNRISLKAVYPEKPYRLNPYAIFYSDGHHYLIATRVSSSPDVDPNKILHFRVDRIMTLTLLSEAREERPESLRDYWKNEKLGFDQQLYSQMHPTMVYSQKPATRKAVLLTKEPIALSIVADAFGKENVRITREHTETPAQGQSSRPKTNYEIEVYGQKDNIIRFCLQQNALVTMLRPQTLVDEVTAELCRSLADYGIFVDPSQNTPKS